MIPRTRAEGYARWRATVPFTDEQIASALEMVASEWLAAGEPFKAERYQRLAAFTRTGKLLRVALSQALPYLILKCAMCDRKALYRHGSEGRCRLHRAVTTDYIAGRESRQRKRDQFFDRINVERDRAGAFEKFKNAMRSARVGHQS